MEVTIRDYYLASYPAIAVCTPDEHAFIIKAYHQLMSLPEKRRPNKIYALNAASEKYDVKHTHIQQNIPIPSNNGQLVVYQRELLNILKEASATQGRPNVYIISDWQNIYRSANGYRPVLNVLHKVAKQGSMLVFLAPNWNMPPELTHAIRIVEDSLPTKEELEPCIKSATAYNKLPAKAKSQIDENMEYLKDASTGLTLMEAENAAALARVKASEENQVVPKIEIITKEKAKLIQQQNGLEIMHRVEMNEVGGMENFKQWVEEEIIPCKKDPKLRVKGALLVGPPGTGKSLICKAVASMLKCPALRMDLAACGSQYHGMTEQNVKNILKIADAVAPAVLNCDEIDSSLGGHKSSASVDGGVTLRVMSILLTWQQEHQSDVLFLATANYPDRIPPALLRPGRLDAIWFVDLPSEDEREEIAKVHLQKLECDVKWAERIAHATPGYSGAEIAQVVLNCARRTKRKITPASIERAVYHVQPLSASRKNEIEEMREWAAKHAQSANTHNNGEQSRKIK